MKKKVACINRDVLSLVSELCQIVRFCRQDAIFCQDVAFTDASTYTSLSGVKKEMRIAIPLEIGAGVAGVGLWLMSRFIA
jgi:hypothetical protein